MPSVPSVGLRPSVATPAWQGVLLQLAMVSILFGLLYAAFVLLVVCFKVRNVVGGTKVVSLQHRSDAKVQHAG